MPIDAVVLRNSAALVAHSVAGFGVPTILTTVAETGLLALIVLDKALGGGWDAAGAATAQLP